MRSDLVAACRQRNEQTADLGDQFAPHREKVMQLIRATVKDLAPDDPDPQCAGLVLIGPGNCLDVDLKELGSLAKSLHLVDLDRDSVGAAVAAAGLPNEQVYIHAPRDIAEPLLSLTSRDFEATEENREYCARVLQNLASENGVTDVPEADVVVSLCVMTQLIDSLSQLIPANHATFVNALKALRLGHLRRLLSMLRPGGVAILVTDIVSSDTVPELTVADEEELAKLIPKLVESRNFFSGTNPSAILGDLNMLNRLPTGPDTVHTIDPWIWDLGERKLAVYALRIQKRPPVDDAPPEDGDGVQEDDDQ